MRTISNTFTISINAKADNVFAYVADLTQHSEWNEGLKVEAVASNPMSVGAGLQITTVDAQMPDACWNERMLTARGTMETSRF